MELKEVNSSNLHNVRLQRPHRPGSWKCGVVAISVAAAVATSLRRPESARNTGGAAPPR